MSTRILTTHVGSLPRGAELADLLFAAEREEAKGARLVLQGSDRFFLVSGASAARAAAGLED